MTRMAACVGALALLVTRFQPTAFRTPAVTMTADQLVARVVGARTSTGFRFRAKLTRTTPGTNVTDVRQLLIEGRRDRKNQTMRYQQLWPKEVAGRALVVADAGDHQLGGFQYQSGRVTRLTARMLANQFFESDLRLEDVAEGFWYWPSHTIVGEEAVGEYRCVMMDFRPGPDTPTAYSLVKAWVSPDLAIALRVEQFGPGGRPVKQIALYRVVKVDQRWLWTIMTVEPADRRSRTVIEGVKYESDLHLSASDFTVEAIRKSARARD